MLKKGLNWNKLELLQCGNRDLNPGPRLGKPMY
jgi:hypothetical protein